MKMTGEMLKAERLKQHLKISDVAFALKLGGRVIESIENGDSNALPAKTFVRGFVKSYAEYLKLDPSVVLRQFQEEMGSTSPVPKTPPPPDPTMPVEKNKKDTEKTNVTPVSKSLNPGLTSKHIWIFVSVSAFVFFIALINHFINKYSREHAEVIEIAQTPAPINSRPLSSDIQKTDAAENMGQTVPQSSNISSDVNDAAGTSQAVVPETKTNESKPVAEIKNSSFPPLEKSNGKPIEVLIEAKKDVVIEYAKGNSTVFEKLTIKQNTYQIIRSQNGLHLRADEASAVNLIVNGLHKTIPKTQQLQMTF